MRSLPPELGASPPPGQHIHSLYSLNRHTVLPDIGSGPSEEAKEEAREEEEARTPADYPAELPADDIMRGANSIVERIRHKGGRRRSVV